MVDDCIHGAAIDVALNSFTEEPLASCIQNFIDGFACSDSSDGVHLFPSRAALLSAMEGIVEELTLGIGEFTTTRLHNTLRRSVIKFPRRRKLFDCTVLLYLLCKSGLVRAQVEPSLAWLQEQAQSIGFKILETPVVASSSPSQLAPEQSQP